MRLESFERTVGKIIRNVQLGAIVGHSFIEDRAAPDLGGAAAWWQSFLRGATVFGYLDPARPLRIVDAFCGCGGLSLGAVLAAISCGYTPKVNAAIDMDEEALKVYSRNLNPETPIAGSVDSLVDFQVLNSGVASKFAYTPEVVDSRLEGYVSNTEIFLAGPPCEGHSNFNNRTRRDDPRNQLYLSAVALGVALRAKAIVIENVPEVTAAKGSVVEVALSLLEESGYRFRSSAVLSAHELGGAQTRKRFFLVATKTEQVVTLEEIRRELKQPAFPVSWAIEDLVDSMSQENVFDSTPVLSEDNSRRIDWLFANDAYNLPDSERPDCHKNGNSYPAVYGRLRWDAPAQTITTGFATPGRGRFIHPMRPRTLTAHEAARLQCFPDSYSFLPFGEHAVKRKHLTKWIGDAVPPVLGFAACLGAIGAIQ